MSAWDYLRAVPKQQDAICVRCGCLKSEHIFVLRLGTNQHARNATVAICPTSQFQETT